ncbi:MAG: hypothetical protein GY797_38035, partial [Deltaproteobacteria bacterium]|nr:hypothetical protein [Deltaproteobacteria bacterium]
MSIEVIKKRIEELNKEQVVCFAWRCAVRALPFLGSNGHFNFWYEKDRQNHLFSIFLALYLAVDRDSIDAARDDIAASRAAIAARYSAMDATRNNRKMLMNLEPILLRDLNTIQNKEKLDIQHMLTDLYGDIWDNFQKALATESCAYWGQLYKDIFDSGFVLDQEALQRRINVPKEIRNQGAAAEACPQCGLPRSSQISHISEKKTIPRGWVECMNCHAVVKPRLMGV